MTGFPVVLHPEAVEEAEAGTSWYAKRSLLAAEGFLDELDRAMSRISSEPEQFPVYDFGTRRVVLRRFPYLIIFRQVPERIEIIAIAHGHRKPGYWRERTF